MLIKLRSRHFYPPPASHRRQVGFAVELVFPVLIHIFYTIITRIFPVMSRRTEIPAPPPKSSDIKIRTPPKEQPVQQKRPVQQPPPVQSKQPDPQRNRNYYEDEGSFTDEDEYTYTEDDGQSGGGPPIV